MYKRTFILYFFLAVSFIVNIFPRGKENLNIALVYPQLTRDILYKNDKSFTPTDSWELFFMSNHYNYKMLNDENLDDVDNTINVLVIPSMEVVSEKIIEELGELLDQGKGILITGNFAQFDEDGNKLNSEYQKRIPGFGVSRLEYDGLISVNHSLCGNTPFSIGLKPGQKILLNPKPSLFYASDLSGDCKSEGNYFLSDGEFSGILSNSASQKRILWFGFGFDQLIGKSRDQFLLNSLKWLSSVPEAFLNYWPENISSAGIIYKDIEKTSDLITPSQLNFGSDRLNYFISPQVIKKSENLKVPADSSDINIIWDDFFFSKLNPSDRENWLNDVKLSIKNNTDQNYYGVLSYGAFYDSSNYNLLSKAGYSFIFSSGYSDSFACDFDSTSNIYLFAQSRAPGTNYVSGLKFIINSGGIFYLNTDSLKDNISDIIENRRCWLTTFSDLLNWEAHRDKLELVTDLSESGSFKINLRNRSSFAVQRIGIWISIPGMNGTLPLAVSSYAGGFTFDSRKQMYLLDIPNVGGYQDVSFRISVPMSNAEN